MTKKPDNLTFVHICVIILTITACAVCIGISVASAKGYYTDSNANYVQEYATIVRYEKFLIIELGAMFILPIMSTKLTECFTQVFAKEI